MFAGSQGLPAFLIIICILHIDFNKQLKYYEYIPNTRSEYLNINTTTGGGDHDGEADQRLKAGGRVGGGCI